MAANEPHIIAWRRVYVRSFFRFTVVGGVMAAGLLVLTAKCPYWQLSIMFAALSLGCVVIALFANRQRRDLLREIAAFERSFNV